MSERPSARARGKIAPERRVASIENAVQRGLGAIATNKLNRGFLPSRNPRFSASVATEAQLAKSERTDHLGLE